MEILDKFSQLVRPERHYLQTVQERMDQQARQDLLDLPEDQQAQLVLRALVLKDRLELQVLQARTAPMALQAQQEQTE